MSRRDSRVVLLAVVVTIALARRLSHLTASSKRDGRQHQQPVAPPTASSRSEGPHHAIVFLAAFVLAASLGGHGLHLVSSRSDPAAASPAQPGASDAPRSANARSIRVQPGWRAEQVGAAIEAGGLGSAERFLELVTDPETLIGPYAYFFEGPTLEGYLSPGVYELPDDEPEAALIDKMLKAFESRYLPALRERAVEMGVSLRDIVTLASIVERETVRYADSPVIAGVFWNRLHEDVFLAADATVAYAIDSEQPPVRGDPNAYWRVALGSEHLAVDSPYNSYVTGGLPPGPIASPSLAAVQATLFPAATDALFFVAKKNDAHVFARSLEEHQQNIDSLSAIDPDALPSGTLQGVVERVMEAVLPDAGIVVKNLVTGEAAYVNPDDYFAIEGGISQLVVSAAAYESMAQGALSEGESLGEDQTVANALLRIAEENAAAAAQSLLTRLTPTYVEAFTGGLGMEHTWLDSSVPLSNARDVAMLLERIVNADGVTPAASARILDALEGQTVRDGLPKYLPEGTRIAHKPEPGEAISHDAGIVYTRSGPIVMVVMMEDTSTEFIALLSKFVYQYFDEYAPVAEYLADRRADCPDNPFKASVPGPLSGRTIVLDAGHGGLVGGSDLGATFRFDDGTIIAEKQITLEATLRLRDLLVAAGATVHLTRCEDVAVPLLTRAIISNQLRPDLFVSLHVNGSTDVSRDGTEVYYFTNQGKIAANYFFGSFNLPTLWHELNSNLPIPNRGARFADFAVLIFADVPAVLTESAYLSNPAEAAAFRDGTGKIGGRQDQIAHGHLKSIIAYFEGRGAR